MQKGTSSVLLLGPDLISFHYTFLFPLQVWKMLSASPLKSWQCLCTSSPLASFQVSSACLYASVKTSTSFNSLNWQSCFKPCQSWSCRLHSSAQSLITQLITETGALWLLGDSESPFSSLTIALGKVTEQMLYDGRIFKYYKIIEFLFTYWFLLACFCHTFSNWSSQKWDIQNINSHMDTDLE